MSHVLLEVWRPTEDIHVSAMETQESSARATPPTQTAVAVQYTRPLEVSNSHEEKPPQLDR